METGYGARRDRLRRAEDAQHTSWRGRRDAIWLYAGAEDVADKGREDVRALWRGRRALADRGRRGRGGEHGYRRVERTYVPWQGQRDAIWLYAVTEDVAEDREDVYRSVLL